MNDLIDKCIIYIACFALYAVDIGFDMSVAPVIIALTISALTSYFYKENLACDEPKVKSEALVALIPGRCKENLACDEPKAKSEALVALIPGRCKENKNLSSDYTFLKSGKVMRLLFMGAYILVCQFQPEFLVFLPVICYDVFVTDEQLFSLLAVIPIFSHFNQCSLTLRIMLIVLILISYLLKFRTQDFNKMKLEFTKYKDTSNELSMLLRNKNRDLMENQDYEIKVAMLNERNRIAMEIHDNVGHLLSRCLLQIGAIMATNKEEPLKENLSSVKDTMSHAMDTIRNSVHDLHDEAIDLYSQIYGLVTDFTFCAIHLDYDLSDNLDIKLKYCFIAIVKEALANIIKHSCATEVNVALREHPALYQLIIQDNGHVSGYNPDNGIGLTNISSRVGTFNGNIHINVENGFKIFISIPK